MKLRIAINGFGRIGRFVFRACLNDNEIEIVAINDLVSTDNLSYLLKYDSVHGRLAGEISYDNDSIVVNGKVTKVFSEKDPTKLPWKNLKVDYVIESTGRFTSQEGAKSHLDAGAKRVIISAPAKDGVPTFVMGVNNSTFNPKTDFIVSNASCTTNCLAPIVKVLVSKFGIKEGLMTTVHAMTATQAVVDGPSQKDWRGGRCASQNIIPSSTGAAKAVALCIPEVNGKLTGMAFRVPVADVSVVDLTVKLERETSYEEICQEMFKSSKNELSGILGYCDEEVVSSDFLGCKLSSIFDVKAGIALNSSFYKLVSWYDNEVGYAHRVIDLAKYMYQCEQK